MNIKEILDGFLKLFKFWVIVQSWETCLIVRCGKRKRVLGGGIYFRLPYFDAVFVQQSRLSLAPLSVQTSTTKCGKTITVDASVGYELSDIEKLYSTLYLPETTIANLAMSKMASFISENTLENLSIQSIEAAVLSDLRANDFGINFKSFHVKSFAVVRTFRLIQDHSWIHEGLDMGANK